MKVEVGVYTSVPQDSGWWRILGQEKIPFRRVEEPDTRIIVFEKDIPDWLESFIRKGGIAIVTEADPRQLPFQTHYSGYGVIHTAHFPLPGLENIYLPGGVNLFQGKGWGEVRIHEKRLTKNSIRNGRFPVFLCQVSEHGKCLYTGMPLTRLLTSVGDTLRTFSAFTEITERVATIDKWKISRILVWVLQKAFSLADLPYVHWWYYPDRAKTVFGFRIDVDGVYGENLVNISRTAKEIGLPLTFFVNKSLCKDEVHDLRRLDSCHEIGNHGDIHNLYDSREENLESLQACQNWLSCESFQNGRWYAGPRGMWNMNLGLALEELGYEYSSDFGLDFDGLPFFPRTVNRKLNVLQIPIHAYSVERAFIYAEETSSREPEAAEILSYFKNVARFKIAHHLPIFFYSHPVQFGRMAHNILPGLKHYVVKEGAKILTLSQFCQWWKERDKLSIEFEYQPKEKKLWLRGEIPPDGSLNIIYPGRINVISKEQKLIMFNNNKLI